MVGRTVQQYQLREKLGAGGSGEVYKAFDTRLNRFVAIKVLSAGMSADPENRRRFIHEAQAASALNHPNIITIYDVLDDGATQYMVMEYVPGKTLLELIFNDGRQTGLQVPDAVGYATQMADALGAAHAAGIIHRDLKPANVMVNSSGLVKLLDFGLAKLVEWPTGAAPPGDTTETLMQNPLTVAGAILGTVNYMSPEQAAGGRLDAGSDIFSFGSVLYEMLTGRCAFRGTSVIATLSAVLRDDVQPIRELTTRVPPELESIVARCMRKDPAQRFQSMQEVNAALKRLPNSDTTYSPPTVRTLPPPSSRGFKLPVIAALILLLAIAGGAGYWWTTRHASPPPSAPTQPPSQSNATPPPDGTLTNDNIVDMTGANVAPSVIMSQIRTSKTNFNLSAPEVIRLTKAGVPADVIEVMRNPAAPAPAHATPIILNDGTPLRLTLSEDIPGDAVQGESLRFKVAHDLQAHGSIVIAHGADATGSIVDGAKKKILGIGGKMTFRLESVDAVDGNKIAIRATAARSHDGPSKRPVTTTAPKPKGLAASAGTEYVGYVDGPQTVTPKK